MYDWQVGWKKRNRDRTGRKCAAGLGSVAEIGRLMVCGMHKIQKVEHLGGEQPRCTKQGPLENSCSP